MNVITKRVPQEVFDRNINKIALSEREYQRELLEKAQGNFKEPKYYGGLNPLNNRRYTQSYLADDQQRADTSFKPNKNFKYYDGGYSTPREDTRKLFIPGVNQKLETLGQTINQVSLNI